MSVVHGLGALERAHGRLFVVVGVFDGLHLGHAYLLDELRAADAAQDALPAVITFDHHPDEILKGAAPPLLCDPEERLQRLESAGVAVTVVQTFDIALRETPFDAFVGGIADRVDLAGFLMTPDSAFGYQRAGTPETVAALGRDLGFEVVIVPPFTLGGGAISSSAIRAAIASGDLATAEGLLGRPYSVVGEAARDTGSAALTPGPGAEPGSSEIRFPMPVALPPTGSYDGVIEPTASAAESVGHTQGGTVGLAINEDGRLVVAGRLGPGERFRVTFSS